MYIHLKPPIGRFPSFSFSSFLTKRQELLGYVKYPLIIIGVAKIPDKKVFSKVYIYIHTFILLRMLKIVIKPPSEMVNSDS